MQIESNMTQRSHHNPIQGAAVSLRSISLMAALCLSISGYSSSVSADTYRWVDDNGVVNYSERKPKDVPESRVTLVSKPDAKSGTRRFTSAANTIATPATIAVAPGRVAPTPNVPEMPQTAELNDDQQAMLKKLQQAEAERLATVAQIKNDNCERSRRVLSNLQQNGRLKVNGKDGSVRVLSEEERQQGIADAQRGIAANCTG